jgi:hypothetical protein
VSRALHARTPASQLKSRVWVGKDATNYLLNCGNILDSWFLIFVMEPLAPKPENIRQVMAQRLSFRMQNEEEVCALVSLH